MGRRLHPMDQRAAVYSILCVANAVVYIGSTKDVRRRWAEHRRDLGRGRHCNPRLQRAWSKYGPDAFVFNVLAIPPADHLLAVEQQYLDLALAWGEVFNVGDRAVGNIAGSIVAHDLLALSDEEWRTKTNRQIADETGRDFQTVWGRRPSHIPPPDRLANVNWALVDWANKSNKQIAREIGCSTIPVARRRPAGVPSPAKRSEFYSAHMKRQYARLTTEEILDRGRRLYASRGVDGEARRIDAVRRSLSVRHKLEGADWSLSNYRIAKNCDVSKQSVAKYRAAH